MENTAESAPEAQQARTEADLIDLWQRIIGEQRAVTPRLAQNGRDPGA